MPFWNIKSKLLLVLISFSFCAQAQENSPYSRYGVGLLKLPENIAARGMGGVCIADNNPFIVNAANPASYSGLTLTSYQLAVEGVSANIQSSAQANRTGGAGLSYVNIGIPTSKNSGISFGLLPYSKVRYNLRDEQTLPGIGETTYDYFGGGGLQKVYLGGAYKYQGLSAGVNLAYNFGNYQNNIEEQFTDSLNILRTAVARRTSLGGLSWQAGLMYNLELKNDYFMNFGVTYSGKQNLQASKDEYWYSTLGDLGGSLYEYLVKSSEEVEGDVILPAVLSAGVLLSNGKSWKVGVDYTQSNWNDYRAYGAADSFSNSYSIRVGGAYTPDQNSVSNGWKRMSYRVGAFTGVDPIYLKNTDFRNSGLTFGLGYPLKPNRLSLGVLNLALETGRRGTTDNDLVRENYTRFAVGITVNDKWFLKRKYD